MAPLNLPAPLNRFPAGRARGARSWIYFLSDFLKAEVFFCFCLLCDAWFSTEWFRIGLQRSQYLLWSYLQSAIDIVVSEDKGSWKNLFPSNPKRLWMLIYTWNGLWNVWLQSCCSFGTFSIVRHLHGKVQNMTTCWTLEESDIVLCSFLLLSPPVKWHLTPLAKLL